MILSAVATTALLAAAGGALAQKSGSERFCAKMGDGSEHCGYQSMSSCQGAVAEHNGTCYENTPQPSSTRRQSR
jgi:hypothetical protein